MQDRSIDDIVNSFDSKNTAASTDSPKGPGRTKAPPVTKPSPGRGGHVDVPYTPQESFIHGAARTTVGALPALGATVGGALATPTDVGTGPFGTIAGAAVGGGLGEAIRQTITRWFPSLGTAPKSTSEAGIETAKQMIYGGAGEAIGPYVNNLFKMSIPAKLKDSAENSLISAMQPKGDIAKGHAIDAAEDFLKGPAFGKDGYVSATKGGLVSKTKSNLAKYGSQIASKEAPVAQKVISQDLTTELDQALNSYRSELYMPVKMKPSATGPVATTQIKYGYEPRVEALDNIKQLIDNEIVPNAAGDGEITRESLRLAKQTIDESVSDINGFARAAAKSKGKLEPAMNARVKVEQRAGNILRKILNKDEPDIAQLNQQYHLWSNVKNAMGPELFAKKTAADPTKWQDLWHVRYGAYLAGAAGITGAAGHYGGAGAAEATGALFAISQIARSTAWKTLSAASKNQLADLLAKGEYENVAKTVAKFALEQHTTLPSEKTKQPPIIKQAGTVKMRAPDGSTRDIPKSEVDHWKSKGATVVQ